MKFFKTPILLLSLFCFAISCKEKEQKIINKAAVEFKKEGTLQILQQDTDTVLVALDIEIADNEYETATGLMYRTSMAPQQGMLFIFEDTAMRSFYMKNTQIPLDIIFLDAEKRIVSFQKQAEPFNETGLSSKAPAKYVLEVNAGKADTWGLALGDRIAYEQD